MLVELLENADGAHVTCYHFLPLPPGQTLLVDHSAASHCAQVHLQRWALRNPQGHHSRTNLLAHPGLHDI